MKKVPILIIAVLFSCIGCKEEKVKPVLVAEEYNVFLNSHKNESYREALAQKNFWSKRLKPDSSGIGDLGPLAGAYESLFQTNGDVENLKYAENLYRKAISIAGNNKDAYHRGLARNLISQHRFKEAKQVLEESYVSVSNKHATELMLFDVYMEVGAYEKAYEFLSKVKNNRDYHYLIRLSKWNDHKGDLDSAIQFMEEAMAIAESRNSKSLRIWTYSNIADYYGHAGRIQDSYDHYIKTLELQPDNAYAKKGLAWIAYSWEKNTMESNRILDEIIKDHKVPDYLLLKAEMAENDGEKLIAENLYTEFIDEVSLPKYGDMYNAYLIELFADSDAEKALTLAETEVENRATPEAYHFLAFATLKNGNEEKALEIIEAYVKDKTFEPMALYHSALVYEANGMDDQVELIQKELLDARFEIGPVLADEVENW